MAPDAMAHASSSLPAQLCPPTRAPPSQLYFVFECVFKLYSFGDGECSSGWQQYWSVREDHLWNRLDFFVLAVELASRLLELILSAAGDVDSSSLRSLRVFRALRVLRAFKLSRFWGPLQTTLQTLVKAISPVASLAILTSECSLSNVDASRSPLLAPLPRLPFPPPLLASPPCLPSPPHSCTVSCPQFSSSSCLHCSARRCVCHCLTATERWP